MFCKFSYFFMTFVFCCKACCVTAAVELEDPAYKKNVVCIYADQGTDELSVKGLEESFTFIAPLEYDVRKLSAEDVKEGRWMKDAAAFIMPSGLDLTYFAKLKGRGNDLIKTYVQQGGSYLGVGAGAYYACLEVDFYNLWKIVERRELGFYPGKCVGSLFPFSYDPPSRGSIVQVICPHTGTMCNTHYNGGGYFDRGIEDGKYKEGTGVSVLFNYLGNEFLSQDGSSILNFTGKAAAIKGRAGKGTFILSAIHPEYSLYSLQESMRNKKNGYNPIKDIFSVLKTPTLSSFFVFQTFLRGLRIIAR